MHSIRHLGIGRKLSQFTLPTLYREAVAMNDQLIRTHLK